MPDHEVSRVHWRVQTRTPEGGWVTRCWSVMLTGATLSAEGYAADLGVAARVLLGETVYYDTEAPAVGASK